MAEFDDKLNSLLSDPQAMDQIMRMARSLMGGEGQTTPPPVNSAAVPTGSPPASNGLGTPPGQMPFSGSPPQSGQAAWNGGQSPSAFDVPGQSWSSPPPNNGGAWGSQASGNSGPDLGFLSGLGSIDPKTIASLLPILRELGSSQNSNARQLLFALRPYLKPERQDKVERALQLARLFRVGKKFLLKGDGYV